MYNDLAKQVLETRRQVDPELSDMVGTEADYLISSAEMNLDSGPSDRLIHDLESSPLTEAFDHSELLQTLTGMEKSDADRFAYHDAEQSLAKRSCSDEIEFVLPLEKRVRVARKTFEACKTAEQLRGLDCSLYKAAGLDPHAYGL